MLASLSFPRLARTLQDVGGAIVFSVQHTGTWFAIEFLRGHPEAGDFFEVRKLLGETLPLTPHHVLQIHLGDSEGSGGLPIESQKFAGEEAFFRMAFAGRAVVPVRDPLLSILTRQNRHPYLDHRYIVQGFRILASAPEETIFLPIDGPSSGRRELLEGVLERLGWPAAPDYVEEVACAWEKRNSSGDSRLKRAYRRGDFEALRRVMPEELEELLHSRDQLRPFLSRLGYEDLSWWNL